MINFRDYIVFDFETGGKNPYECEPIQLAAQAFNCRTLEPYPEHQGGKFKATLMKPLNFDKLEKGALKVNGITVEQLQDAPDQKVVWLQFVEWVNSFNRDGKEFTAPLAAGKNIDRFDLIIADRMNEMYCAKKEKTVLFNRYMTVDLEKLLFFWFENQREPKSHKMDELREYFGLSTEGAHDAGVDVEQTGQLIMRFLRLQRACIRTGKVSFKRKKEVANV